MAVRSPRQIIDQAVDENRFGERLLYGFATGFVVVGLLAVSWAVVSRSFATGLFGAVSSALFVPAMQLARKTRKESIAIRLLEAPLSRADTAKEAADAIRQIYRELMQEKGDGQESSTAVLRMGAEK